jgi:RHS repeat-associated protein
VEYEYDDEGNRVRKVIDSTVVINYLVDTNRDYAQVLEERDGNEDLVVRYVYSHDLISQSRDGATTYYHYDGLGSTRALTSSAEAITDTYNYDAFGNLLDKTGSTINPYLYRGEQYDADLSAYYLRARYYQPGIGRFLTTDHVEGFPNNPMTLHRYVYGNGVPIRYVDPSGTRSLIEQSTVAGIILQLAGWGLGAAAVVCEDIADSLAAVLPDAGLVGVSGFISINAKSYLRWIFDTGPIDVLELPDLGSGFGGSGGVFGGVEQVYSISSAQYGTYLFYGLQGFSKAFQVVKRSTTQGHTLPIPKRAVDA